jgi:hypothetical protein
MFDCRRKVELDVAHDNTKAFSAVLYRVGQVRALQERFARNTADVNAHSTELISFDDGGVQPELGAADGANVSGRSPAEHDDVESLSHGSFLDCG